MSIVIKGPAFSFVQRFLLTGLHSDRSCFLVVVMFLVLHALVEPQCRNQATEAYSSLSSSCTSELVAQVTLLPLYISFCSRIQVKEVPLWD